MYCPHFVYQENYLMVFSLRFTVLIELFCEFFHAEGIACSIVFKQPGSSFLAHISAVFKNFYNIVLLKTIGDSSFFPWISVYALEFCFKIRIKPFFFKVFLKVCDPENIS
jgi:hypothetical protein